MKKILLFWLLWLPTFYIQAQDVLVVIKEDGIYQTDFTTVTKLNGGSTFQKPLINSQRTLVTYLDEANQLYVQALNESPSKLVVPVDKGVCDYGWSDGELIYAKCEGGLYKYDSYDGSVTSLIDANSKFEHLIIYKNMVYGNQFIKQRLHDEEVYKPIGVVQIGLSQLTIKELVAYRGIDETKTDIEVLGFFPQVAKLSDDGAALYIWCKVNSGSLNADSVGLGYYDLNKSVFTPLNQVAMLGYDDQFDINPIQTEELVLINGQGRMMNENKHLSLITLTNDKLTDLSEAGMVYLTPSYSFSGDRVIFSAGAEQKDVYKPFTTGQNHLYELNLKTTESRQLTFEEAGFDFYPRYLSDESFMFIRRYDNKQLDVVRRDKTGRETIVISHLLTNGDNGYYGHLEMNQILDLKLDNQ